MENSHIKSVIKHKEIGDIFVVYNEASLMITDVFLQSSNLYEDVKLSNIRYLKNAHAEVYEYLKNFSKDSVSEFAIESLDLSYLSPFQRRVHRELFNTKVGDRLTYKSLATLAGSERAYRAVGTAMSVNRLLILIPCHRVLSVNNLGGYSGGLNIKRMLLNIERGYETNSMEI